MSDQNAKPMSLEEFIKTEQEKIEYYVTRDAFSSLMCLTWRAAQQSSQAEIERLQSEVERLQTRYTKLAYYDSWNGDLLQTLSWAEDQKEIKEKDLKEVIRILQNQLIRDGLQQEKIDGLQKQVEAQKKKFLLASQAIKNELSKGMQEAHETTIEARNDFCELLKISEEENKSLQKQITKLQEEKALLEKKYLRLFESRIKAFCLHCPRTPEKCTVKARKDCEERLEKRISNDSNFSDTKKEGEEG
jgi:hypothetical protein